MGCVAYKQPGCVCCRFLISQHPEVEQRILEELAQHQLMAGPHGSARDIQYEDLGRLTYLNCVIKVPPAVTPLVAAPACYAALDEHCSLLWMEHTSSMHLQQRTHQE